MEGAAWKPLQQCLSNSFKSQGWGHEALKPLSSLGTGNYGGQPIPQDGPRAVISCVWMKGARWAEGGRGATEELGPWLPGRRASAGPMFIIQHALYFGLGARLITAYRAQGGTRHHLTLPQTVGCYLDFRQGGRKGILSLTGGLDSKQCVFRHRLLPPDSISVGKWNSLPSLAQYPGPGNYEGGQLTELTCHPSSPYPTSKEEQIRRN